MTLLSSAVCDFGQKTVDFSLLNIDGKIYKKSDLLGVNGTLIMFICNHCPYVKAILSRLVKTTLELESYGISSLAIMPNDSENYPEDSFENMKQFSKRNKFNFPYLIDESQEISKKYSAVCTPEFFGYNKNEELNYRGRLSEMKNLEFVNDKNELLEAMIMISKTNKGPLEQYPSSGCSIKWRNSI